MISQFNPIVVWALRVLLVVCVAGAQMKSWGQNRVEKSTSSPSLFRKNFLTPAILISAGLIATTDNEVFDKWEVHEARDYYCPAFKTHADDYLQFAPIVAAYAFDAFGSKGEHGLWPKTFLLIKSEVLLIAMTEPLKHLTAVPRPDTGAKDAFPSGHTAQAFAAATFFHKEYGHKHRLYGIAAYTLASSVGVLRILNNRHWISDVLAGAGIGILATNLGYLTERIGARHKRSLSGLTAIPYYSRKSIGFSISMVIK